MSRSLLSIFLLSLPFLAEAQQSFTENRLGHIFYLSVPDYMSPTLGLNDHACAQYQCLEKDLFTFVIEEAKDQLDLVDLHFNSLEEFYNYFEERFLQGTRDRKVEKPVAYQVGNVNFIQTEATYFDPEIKETIYYLVTIAETKTHYYQILSYTPVSNQEMLKPDMIRIANSIHD